MFSRKWLAMWAILTLTVLFVTGSNETTASVDETGSGTSRIANTIEAELSLDEVGLESNYSESKLDTINADHFHYEVTEVNGSKFETFSRLKLPNDKEMKENSTDTAREKLMKVNPNLVEFIEKVMKKREQSSGYVSDFFANTWKAFEENQTEDELSDICLFSPTGACHVHVSNKCKIVTYESLFLPKGQKDDICRIHEKYLSDAKTKSRGLKIENGLSQIPSLGQFNHTNIRQRYKCELNTNIFPANQTGIVKALTPERFVEVINGSRSCILAMFYSPYCAFSVKFAPHVNALARNFPAIHVVAVNALLNKHLDARIGVVGTPSLLFLYNDQTIGRYSASDFHTMSQLMSNLTGLTPGSALDLVPSDYEEGVLPVKLKPHIDLAAVASTLICLSFACALLIQFTPFGFFMWIKFKDLMCEIPLVQFFVE